MPAQAVSRRAITSGNDSTTEIGGEAVPIAIDNDELREAGQRRPQREKGASLCLGTTDLVSPPRVASGRSSK